MSKKQELKNKISELVEKQANKLREKFKEQSEPEMVLLDPEELEATEDEIYQCLKEMAEESLIEGFEEVKVFEDIPRYVDCDELVDLEPTVEMREEDIEYKEEVLVEPFYIMDEEHLIPINEVELDEEEIQELEEITKDLEAIELEEHEVEPLTISCNVNGQEKKLVDNDNCHIFKLPLLGLYMVSPKNLLIAETELTSGTEEVDDILLSIVFEDEDKILIYKVDVKMLLDAGLLTLVGMFNPELNLTPVAFRGMTKKVELEELENLFKEGVEEQC